MSESASDCDSIEDLLNEQGNKSIHIECRNATSRKAINTVRTIYQHRRCAFFLESDNGFGRDTVRSYLVFFSRLAGSVITAAEAMKRFDIAALSRTPIRKLTREQRALVNFARLFLFEPEVVFCERPLANLEAHARSLVLNWIANETDRGTIFISVGEPLREALLMPGDAWWEEEGRFFPAQTDDGSSAGSSDAENSNSEVVFAGDEVRVCKVQAKTEGSTLLFDPREIDFIESINRQNFVSVRGELYQTPSTLDELESELAYFGFFRCHRSYIVNVQRIAKIERFTRNSFNLTLSDAAHSSIPLAKGRAEEMRATLGMK